ncbi:MAG: hypothetical protein H6721_28600 [Sandaracinus sp.]|nr:hypothetical protein [Myxococcales bacterium]MCB9601847.1 hypothetical protein [Sandaracinus sp.]MCB9611579.1 hypothetical protein [Sandaracinus sp.]MCB9618793.1 hypothetical protein [Sandaracinus sp.]MCB9636089.1 hypothetical protein [Sandaracinus sp.]
MELVTMSFPGAERAPFCRETYALLARRDGLPRFDPATDAPHPTWSPILLVHDALELAGETSWDAADADLVRFAVELFRADPLLGKIAGEVLRFRRWLLDEGLGSEEGVDSLEALESSAGPRNRHERRAAAKLERKPRRRSGRIA